LLTITLAAALVAPQLITPPTAPRAAEPAVAWFEGTWPEAVALAEREDRPLFIEFWRPGCGWCKQLEEETFPAPAVRSELEDFVCFEVSSESPEGLELAKTFNLQALPAMFFLNSEAQLEDVIFGYMAPADLAVELQRVKRGEETFTALEARVAADPKDLDAHFALANKKWALGDSEGYYHHVHIIEAADPELRSLPMRRMVLGGLQEELYGCRYVDGVLDPTRILEFLAAEQHEELLFDGWSYLARVQAQEKNAPASAQAFREAWGHVPALLVGRFGHEIGWTLWPLRADLAAEDAQFVLEVAKRAYASFEEQGGGTDAARADYLDVLACAHHMSGDRAKAIELGERSLALAPDRRDIRTRLSQFKLGR